MNMLGALLAILNIATILGPVAGVAVVYQGNLQQMVIPSELQEIIDGNVGGNGGGGLLNGATLQLPQFVNAVADPAARSVTIYLNFNNPFNYDLNLNSISADVVCQAHNFVLGHASLLQPTVLKGSQTSNLAVVCLWTAEAENHFLSSHPGSAGVDVNVVGLKIEVNGLTVRSNEPYPIPDLPISSQISPPEYLNSVTDYAGRTVTLTFKFANPLSTDLHVTAVSANVVCSTHGFLLGQATLTSPVTIPASQSGNFQITCTWTQGVETHLTTEHANAKSIDADVTDLVVNVNGITIHAPSSYHVPNVPLT